MRSSTAAQVMAVVPRTVLANPRLSIIRARTGKAVNLAFLDERPILLAVAGPNGAGKSTFYHAHLKSAALRFVNADKLASRFPRTLGNLQTAIGELPHVLVYDNDDLRSPFRQIAVFEQGKLVSQNEPVPKWLRPLMEQR